MKIIGLRAAALLVAYLATGISEQEAMAESVVTAREMTQNLQLTGRVVTWPVEGEILPPLLSRPGGEVLIFVKGGAGGIEVQHRDPHGRQLGRAAVPSDGRLFSARVFGNRLLIATRGTVQALDANSLQQVEQRAFPPPLADADVIVGPRGAWVLTPDELAYVDLGGESWNKKWPLTPWDLPPCPADRASERACVEAKVTRTADTTDAGDLLVIETAREWHPIKGIYEKDAVFVSRATWIDVKGDVVSSAKLSRAESHGEWFWSQSSSGNPTGIPSHWGLYRTRYRSSDSVSYVVAGRASTVIIARAEKGGTTRLTAVDRFGHDVWHRRVDLVGDSVVSPSWTVPMLIHDFNCTHLFALSKEGKLLEETNSVVIGDVVDELYRTSGRLPRLTIGQADQKTWLLYAYGPKSGGQATPSR